VQELLGHACSKTTARYKHMTDKCRDDRVELFADSAIAEACQVFGQSPSHANAAAMRVSEPSWS
jgi:hypothetical protein